MEAELSSARADLETVRNQIARDIEAAAADLRAQRGTGEALSQLDPSAGGIHFSGGTGGVRGRPDRLLTLRAGGARSRQLRERARRACRRHRPRRSRRSRKRPACRSSKERRKRESRHVAELERLVLAGPSPVRRRCDRLRKERTVRKPLPPSPAATPAPKVLYWYDPMKPEVHFDHPGKSPVHGHGARPEIRRGGARGRRPAQRAARLSVVRIPLERRQEIGVTTAKVEKRPIGGRASRPTASWPKTKAGSRRSTRSSPGTSRSSTWTARGSRVRRGQPLLSVYSPDLVATERELLLAAENVRRLSGSASPAGGFRRAGAARRHAAAPAPLGHSRFGDRRASRRPAKSRATLTLSSPASGVVLKKDAVAGMAITPGHAALHDRGPLDGLGAGGRLPVGDGPGRARRRGRRSRLRPLPGETFQGRVDFVYPTLTEETRTVKVRIVVPNPKGSLKPGMFVRVSLRRTRQRRRSPCPRSALIQTGERQIAFVEQSPGVYAPREVKTGPAGEETSSKCFPVSPRERPSSARRTS